jgi:hypothetical protein
MNRIEIALPSKGAPGKGQPIPDDAATAQGKNTAFKNLLRQMSVKDGPVKPETGEKSDGAKARPVDRDGAFVQKKPDVRIDDKKTRHGAHHVGEVGADVAASAEIAGQTAPEAPIVWPEALTQSMTDPRSATKAAGSGEPADERSTAAHDLGRAVSMALPSSHKSEPGVAKSAQAGAQMPTEADNAKNPFAVLNSMLKHDESELDIASEPEVKAAPKMTVVVRETHFEPVQRLSPIQQIATVVADEATALDEAQFGRHPDPVSETPLRSESSGPLRVLHIKLEPDDLGTVVLKMRLVNQSLELHLETSRAETAQLLEKDKEMLTRVLRASGYTPDVVTIQAAGAPDSAQSQTGQSGSQGSSSNGSPSQGSASQNSQSGEGREQQAHQSVPHKDQSNDEAGANRPRGDLYL